MFYGCCEVCPDGDGEDHLSHEGWYASDDVKGGPLPPHLVALARKREIQYLI